MSAKMKVFLSGLCMPPIAAMIAQEVEPLAWFFCLLIWTGMAMMGVALLAAHAIYDRKSRSGVIVGTVGSLILAIQKAKAVILVIITLAAGVGVATWAAIKIWSKAAQVELNKNAKPAAEGTGGGGVIEPGGFIETMPPTVTPPKEAPTPVGAEFGDNDGVHWSQYTVPPYTALQRSTNLVDWEDVMVAHQEWEVANEAADRPQCFYRLRPSGETP